MVSASHTPPEDNGNQVFGSSAPNQQRGEQAIGSRLRGEPGATQPRTTGGRWGYLRRPTTHRLAWLTTAARCWRAWREAVLAGLQNRSLESLLGIASRLWG